MGESTVSYAPTAHTHTHIPTHTNTHVHTHTHTQINTYIPTHGKKAGGRDSEMHVDMDCYVI